MSVLRIALAQVDLVVGDLDGNRAMVRERVRQAAEGGAQLVVFPEMTLTGYPPEDLVLRASFRQASCAALTTLAAELAAAGHGGLGVVVGYLDTDGGPRNAAAFLQDGQVVARYFKHHLPNYGVFDEDRYFTAGNRLTVVRFGDLDIGLTICEDVWQDGGPFAAAAVAEVGLLVNINGSPYERNKDDVRLPLLQRRAREAHAAVVYVNQCGGQDELVFDGDSFVVDADGTLLGRAPQFTEGLYLLELDLPASTGNTATRADDLAIVRCQAPLPPVALAGPLAEPLGIAGRLPDEAEVWAALVTGTRDYAVKNGFSSVVLGMSGGIDSAVVAAIAADAIGGANVYGVALPSDYSSEHSLADAVRLAANLGAPLQTVPIAPMVSAFVESLKLTGLAEENVQARVRGTTLMALSNQHGHLVLATGNKSELSVGYSTIYGDAVGGFAPIKDVPKDAGVAAGPLAQRRGGAARRAAADPGELDQQAAVGGAAARPAGHRLAARLRAAGPAAGPLRRLRRRLLRPAGGRLRRGAGDPGGTDDRRRGVEAAAVPAGAEDQPQGVRQGPPAADHQPLAGAQRVRGLSPGRPGGR